MCSSGRLRFGDNLASVLVVETSVILSYLLVQQVSPKRVCYLLLLTVVNVRNSNGKLIAIGKCENVV